MEERQSDVEIESLPLAQRAAAYADLADQLQAELQQSDQEAEG